MSMQENDEQTVELTDEQFESLARNAVNAHDAPPANVTALAKLAFEVRGIPVESESPLAGVRSAPAKELVHLVRRGDTELAWSVESGGVVGVYSGSFTKLFVQTATSTSEIEADVETGVFEHDVPLGPYRIVVDDDGTKWATGWVSDAPVDD